MYVCQGSSDGDEIRSGNVIDLYPTNPLTHICNQKASENSPGVVPTKTKYIIASGKQVLTLLQSAATVIPVPMLREAIGVAVKIIEVCEVRGILPKMIVI